MNVDKEYFTPGAAVYARKLLSICLSRWWWALALPLAALFVAGMYDIRWIFVALMATMILIPALLAFIYFHFALSPEIAARIVPHRIVKEDAGITIEYKLSDAEQRTPQSQFIPYSAIVKTEDNGSYTTLFLAPEPYNILIIPSEIAAQLKLA